MVISMIIASTIETAIIIYTLNRIFDIHFSIKTIICFILCTIEILLIKKAGLLDSFYMIIPILTYVLYTKIELKTIKITFFIFPMLLSILLMFSRYIAHFCVEFLVKIPEINFVSNEFMYTKYIISIHIFLVFCFLIYFIAHHQKENIRLSDWWLHAITLFILLAMFTNLLQSVIYSNFSIYTIYSLITEFIILTICIISLYFKLKKQTKIALEMSQQLAKMQYQNQMYNIVSKVKDQLINERHMMLYNFMNMKLLLATNSKKELKEYIDKEIDKAMKYKYISSTGNALFDYTLTNKLNNLMYKNIDVKTVFLLSKNNFILEDDKVIDYMVNCIDYIVSLNVKNIEIFLQEYNEKYLLFKLIIYSKNSLRLKQEDFMFERVKKINLINEKFYYEISILLG